jgi:hypothetical protein
MANTFFSQEEEHRILNAQGKVNEANTKTLLSLYNALIKTFNRVQDDLLRAKVPPESITDHAYQAFCGAEAESMTGSHVEAEDFLCHVLRVDSFGNPTTNKACMTILRMQIQNVSGLNKENLGSIVYAQSFVMIDESSLYINATQNVPNLQAWMTNINHYESLPLEINTVKNLECEHLGDRLRAAKNSNAGVLYENVRGLLPVKSEYKDSFSDVVLNGKLVFYEKGMIFVDNRLHAIVMPFDKVATMTIYQANEWWLQV